MAKTITLSDNDDSELIRADYFADRAFDVFALDGDDQITMAGSANPILDPFAVRSGNDFVSGGAGNDIISAGEGHDEISGDSGNDVLDGGVGDDTLDGGSNSDTLILSWGNDAYDGGSGYDILDASLMNLTEMVTGLTPIFYDSSNPDSGMAGGVFIEGGVSLSLLSGVGFRLDEEGAQDQFSRLGRSSFINIEEFRFSDRNDTFTDNNDGHVIVMGAGADQVFALGGDDTIDGGSGGDIIDGGAGTDTVTYAGSNGGVSVSLGTEPFQGTGSGGDAAGDRLIRVENLVGSRFSDTLFGNDLANRFEGGNGIDILWGQGGDDTLIGGAGNDLIVGGAGADLIDGGGDLDTADFLDLADAVTVTLRGTLEGTAVTIVGGATVVTDILRAIENVNGTAFGDILTGDDADNQLNGGRGNDTLAGNRGNDRLIGGEGIDTARFSALTTGIIAELRDGAAGIATAFYRAADGSVAAVETDTMIGIENLEGTNFRDYLNGDAGDNLLRGNGDSDVLFGGGGNDRLEGGFGDDTYVLTDFTDTVIDSSGIDTINSTITRSLAAHATIENLKLIGTDNTNATGNGLDNTLTGNGGNNVLDGVAGEDTLIGGLGDDTFVLADGSDTVTDTGGIDTITTTVSRTIAANIEIENLILLGTGGLTGTGNGLGNRITGNAGANALVGAGGNDTLRGGAARDVLIGGADNDTFAYLGAADSTPGALRDVIQDFNDAGNDTIDVSALIAGVMRFRGTSAFTAANQVRLNDVAGANVVVEVNLDANLATVEMEILLASTDVTTLGAADFIL